MLLRFLRNVPGTCVVDDVEQQPKKGKSHGAEQCLKNNQAKLGSQCKSALQTPQK